MTDWKPTIAACDTYMDERTGRYEYRAHRYRMAADSMFSRGLRDGHTIFDVGAGMTEFAYCLMNEYAWRGRYIPVDGGIDGTDLEHWTPPREAHWFVALEILEHLAGWDTTLTRMQKYATVGVVVSTPNPRTTDVMAMDPTHRVAITPEMLERHGLAVKETRLYGGVFSNGEPDALFGVWTR